MSFFKSTVMASAVVLGAVFAAPANAALSATDIQTFTTYDEPYSGAYVLSAGVYSLSLSLVSSFTSPTKGFSVVGVTVEDALGTVFGQATATTGGSTTTGSGSSVGTFNLASGTYFFNWSGSTKFGSTQATATLTGTPLPSPGPVAGAGLPILLGMMGFAAWRRRQAA